MGSKSPADSKQAESLGDTARQPGYNPNYPPVDAAYTNLPPPEYPGVGSSQSATNSNVKYVDNTGDLTTGSSSHGNGRQGNPEQQHPPPSKPAAYPSHSPTQARAQQTTQQQHRPEVHQQQNSQQQTPQEHAHAQQRSNQALYTQSPATSPNVQQPPPPAPVGAYPTYINQQPQMNPQDTAIITAHENVGFKPQVLFCPKCGKGVASKVSMENGCCTYTCAFGLCFICCCCLAFCFPWTKDAVHKCPHCKSGLGSKTRVL